MSDCREPLCDASGFSGVEPIRVSSLRDMQASPGAAGLILGLLEHRKSLEFDTVTMWPCSFKELPGAENQRSRDERIRAVYLAMTRVCNELWLPDAWLELLTD